MLVHVCRRWRNLAFSSPRHLNLQLRFRPPKRSVKRMLDIWPELPIYIDAVDCSVKEVRDNVAAALGLSHRVSRIRLEGTSDSVWKTFGSLMKHPFPTLTHLLVRHSDRSTKGAISRSLLGGSAPSLRDLYLDHVPFPALPELLLSSTNLVRLRYDNIPRSGYISPQAIVTGLSMLTRLQSLSLTFRSRRPHPDREIQIPPPHTRTLLPALTHLCFWGVPGYMEDLVAQIDVPSLEKLEITFFHQEVLEARLEVSELPKFVGRADKLSLVDRAEAFLSSGGISVELSLHSWVLYPKTFTIYPVCDEWDLRLSYLGQFCASCLPTPFPFECLYICHPIDHAWPDVKDDPDPQWLELLRPFSTVKHLRLSHPVASRVAKALGGLPAERVLEVLPALEIVYVSGLKHFGSMKEAISEFAHARQLSGHPVSIYDWGGRERLIM